MRRPGRSGGDRSCVGVRAVQARGMTKKEIDEKVRELAVGLQRLVDLVGGQEALLAGSSGRARQMGGPERRGAPSSSPQEALRAVGNALRAITVAVEGAEGVARQAPPGAAQPASQPSNQVASIVLGSTPFPWALGDQHHPSAP